MPVLSNTAVRDVMFRSTKAIKVYLGTKLVWQKVEQGLAKDYSGTGWYKATDTGIVYCKGVPDGETHIFGGDPKEYMSTYEPMVAVMYADIVATSNITDMANFFTGGYFFNSDISHWDTSNVTTMRSMFENARSFNQDISSWDTSKVTDMGAMFSEARTFNQDLSGWCVSKIASIPSNFDKGATRWTMPKPSWGYCPRGENGTVTTPPFDPLSLFNGGEQGIWYDPSDKSTLFQDVDGTVPVTKDGDPVALIKDKSGNGNHATQPTASARPIYHTDGILHWLEFDGIDDHLICVDANSKINTPELTTSITVFNKNKFAASFLGHSSGNTFQTAYILRASTSTAAQWDNRGSRTSMPVSWGTPITITVSSSSSEAYAQVNESSRDSASIGTSTLDTTGDLLIGVRNSTLSAAAFIFRGNIYGVIMVAQHSDATLQDNIHNHMRAKTGVTL